MMPIKRITLLFSLLLLAGISQAQQINMNVIGRVVGQQDDRAFGFLARTWDINGDGFKDLIIGSPDTDVAGLVDAGRLYRFLSPVRGDTALSSTDIILVSDIANYRLGSNFEIADLDNDGNFDIIVANPFINNENGEIRIFFGPFSMGNPRNLSSANIVIEGENRELLGSTIHIARGFSGNARPSLFIGAPQANGNRGRAYVFRELNRQTPTLRSSANASITFNGNENLSFFGESVVGLGDVNGDGHADVLIGSPNGRANGSNSGTIYLYFGPFDGSSYQDNQANVKILGRTQFTLWGGRLFAHPDSNNDNLSEFSISATGDENGKVAFFRGRATWPDTIRVGLTPNAGHAHQLFQLTGGTIRGTGFSLDFSGDFDKDGALDPIIASPFTSSNSGQFNIFNFSGTNRRAFNLSNPTGAELFFARHVVNMGNVSRPEDDPYDIDDLYVGAPGVTNFVHNVQTGGVAYVYSGVLTPPSVQMTYTPGTVNAIGDSIQVTVNITTGSRPIIMRRLIRTNSGPGRPIVRDTIHIEAGVSQYRYWQKSSLDARIELLAQVQDNLGATTDASGILHFAANPLPFNLTSEFTETIRLEGSRRREVDFMHEATVDTNGNSIRYQLYFGTQLSQFQNLANLTLIQSKNTPNFTVDFEALSNYLINQGLISATQDHSIYWSVRATNIRTPNIQLRSIFAENGPREIRVRRLGLDPFFSIPSQPRSLVISGFSDNVFNFTWNAMSLDNPNALVDYTFLLLTDSTASGRANPIFQQRVPQQTTPEISYNLSFFKLDSVLIARDLKNIARTDTARLFYTVRAVIDGQTATPWFPTPRAARANVRFNVIIYVSNEDDPTSDLPKDFELKPNYPNPFNPTTQLRYALPQARDVRVEVFNIAGQRVYHWQSPGKVPAGFHEHAINAVAWSSGVYIYRVVAGDWQASGKMTLIK